MSDLREAAIENAKHRFNGAKMSDLREAAIENAKHRFNCGNFCWREEGFWARQLVQAFESGAGYALKRLSVTDAPAEEN